MNIVGSFACSHAGLLVDRLELVSEAQRSAVYDGFRAMGDAIRDLEPDAIVLVAADHSRVYPLTCVPQFIIGTRETAEVIGDAHVPPCVLPVHQPFAQSILRSMLDAGVDLAFSEAMRLDHSFIVPIFLAFGDRPIPIVPISQNCNCPPLPPLSRSRAFGMALRYAITSGPAGRVVVIGTGDLSHWAGSEPEQAFMRPPAGTRLNANRQTSLADMGQLNTGFDRMFLDLICSGRSRDFVRNWTSEQIFEEAGNGAQELRNWITVATAANDAQGDVMMYEPVAGRLTGASIVSFR